MASATEVAARPPLDAAIVAPHRPANLTRRSNALASLVLLLGMFVTLLGGAYLASRPGVYWSEEQVLFLAPQSRANPNGYSASSQAMIDAAGIVALKVGSAHRGAAVVSDAVTLAGQGVRHGYSIRLPNSGGQWATNFDQPLLDVQVVGSSPLEVSTTLSAVLARISTTLSDLQQAAGVSSYNLIRTELNPQAPPLYYQGGSRTRAAAGTLALGLGLAVAAARAVRRRSAGGGRRQRQAPRVS